MTFPPSPPVAPVRRRLGAAILAVVIAVSGVLASAPAVASSPAVAAIPAGPGVPAVASSHAAPALPATVPAVPASGVSPSPTPSMPSGIVSLTLSPYDSGVVRPERPLTVAVTLVNDSRATVGPVHVSLQIGATALPDRRALTDWLAGDMSGAALTTVAEIDIESVAAVSQRQTNLVVAGTDPQLVGRAPGVYPLVASYSDGAGVVASPSVMVVPSDTTVTPAGLVVPITTGPMSAGLLTSGELADLTAIDGDLTAELDAVAGSRAILAIDPALPAAIRALGDAAPTTATAWLARLEALPNSRFALQFGDADIAAQLQSGQARPAQPTSLNAYLRPVDFPQSGAITPTPAPSSSSTAIAVLPSLADLLEVGGSPNVFWPATGTAGADVVASLGAQGTTLLASSSIAEGADGASVPARATAGDAALLVYDALISTALRNASRVDDPALRGAPVAAAQAYLFFAASQAGGQPLLLTVDRASDRTAAGLAATIDAVTAAPGITLVPYTQVATGTAPISTTIVDVTPDPVRVAAASALFAEEQQLAPLSSVLADPTLLTGPARAELLQLLGNGWRDRPGDAETAWQVHRTRTSANLGAVGILEPAPVNLAGSGAPLGIWVRNDLPYPAEVTLVVTPDDPRLSVQRTTAVTVPAQSNTRVKVPVEARVGNGEVTLDLRLHSGTGETIGPVRTVEVSVRAEWEGLGIAILSVLVGALVVLGLIRTVLRRRALRRRRAVE